MKGASLDSLLLVPSLCLHVDTMGAVPRHILQQAYTATLSEALLARRDAVRKELSELQTRLCRCLLPSTCETLASVDNAVLLSMWWVEWCKSAKPLQSNRHEAAQQKGNDVDGKNSSLQDRLASATHVAQMSIWPLVFSMALLCWSILEKETVIVANVFLRCV
eukprot:5579934-Amphidinium_carterae.3